MPMPTREQMIADLQSSQMPTREQMLADLMQPNQSQGESFLNYKLPESIPLVGGARVGEDIIRPSLQGVGAALGGIGGGALGAAAGGLGAVPGAIAGGGAGYAGGEQLYRTLQGIAGEPIGTVGEETTRTLGNIGKGMLMETAGMGAGAAISGAAKAIPGALKSGASGLYKVPKAAIERIVKRPEAIKAAAMESPQDAGMKLFQNILEAKKLKVTEANNLLNNVVSEAEQQGKLVDVSSVVNALKNNINKIKVATPKAQAQKKELQMLLDYIDQFSKEKTTIKGIKSEMVLDPEFGGVSKISTPIEEIKNKNTLTPSDANILKRQLQDVAFPQNPETGLQFYRKDPVGEAAKQAAKQARLSVEKVIPEVKGYNKTLSDILKIQTDKKFTSAFDPKNIERTMKNVQSPSGNKGYVQQLIKDADKVLGSNIEETTLDYFAAKYMQPGEGISAYTTGRSAYPATLGFFLGGAPGAAAGAVAGSPATFRAVAPRIGKLAPLQQGIESLAGSAPVQATMRSLPYAIGREEGR